MNVAAAVKGPPLDVDFFDEKGFPKEYRLMQMNVLSGTSSEKPIMITFGCGLTPLSFDRKSCLQVDTGADANAINKKTFDQLFPDVELEESTFVLRNFDKRLIKPVGSFRCFLRWKEHKYRVQIEVMGIDTPNILSRETTFLMGILKKCLAVEKVPIEQGIPENEQNLISISEDQAPPTEGAFGHSVLSTEAVFSHSVTPTKEDLPHHLVPPTKATPRSQMNCASISDTAESPETPISSNSGSNIHSLSITDLPLTQEKKWNQHIQTYSRV